MRMGIIKHLLLSRTVSIQYTYFSKDLYLLPAKEDTKTLDIDLFDGKNLRYDSDFKQNRGGTQLLFDTLS